MLAPQILTALVNLWCPQYVFICLFFVGCLIGKLVVEHGKWTSLQQAFDDQNKYREQLKETLLNCATYLI